MRVLQREQLDFESCYSEEKGCASAGAGLATAALWVCVAGCASDKKVPQPPESSVVDVTQPAELGAARALLEQATGKAGEAGKVDAYHSNEGCAAVAKFYQREMKGAHWTEQSLAQSPGSPSPVPRSNPAGLPVFTQSWKYMARTVYVTGATPNDGSGCMVMIASYGRQSGRNNQSR